MNHFCILYTRPGSYTRACLKALSDCYGTKIRAIIYKPLKETPFDRPILDGVADFKYRDEFNTANEIINWVLESRPDCLFVCGWSDRVYLQAARALKKLGVFVVCSMDNQYQGTFKQYFASLISKPYLHTAFNSLWVPGERQAQFAKRLGFSGQSCWRGLYSCDVDVFCANSENNIKRKKSFLFVGRYVERKGLDILMEAYAAYRSRVREPWGLACIGSGDLNFILKDQPGVKDLGFIQPENLPSIMFEYGCFVLPSRFEAWGVVVHEAASAGMPIICSEAVGASVHLVNEHYNGYTFKNEDVSELATCLKSISEKDAIQLEQMSENSRQISKQYSPQFWANILVAQTKLLSQ